MAGYIQNIFISGYSPTHPFQKYDVVSGSGCYFVATQDTSGQLDTSTYTSNTYWKRFDESGFNFSEVWTPTYQTSLAIEVKPRATFFGDGYSQRSEASVFFNRLNYEVQFKDINNRELKGLVALFEYKGGVEPFQANILPFFSGRRFLAQNWTHDYKYFDLNDLTVTFLEYIGQ